MAASKNPNAVALGRRKSPRKAASSRQNGALGGRPSIYRLTRNDTVERLQNGRWVILEPPLNEAAKAFLRRRK